MRGIKCGVKVFVACMLFCGVAFANKLEQNAILEEASQNLAQSPKSTEAEKSGIFVGLYGGVALMELQDIIVDEFINLRNVKTERNVSLMGVKLGYQHFFTQESGVRGYVSYDRYGKRDMFRDVHFAQTNLYADIVFQNIALNIDAMLHYYNSQNFSIGLFSGLGFGYGISTLTGSKEYLEYIKDLKFNGFNVFVNLGLNAQIFAHHQIELGTKIPLNTTLSAKYEASFIRYTNPFSVKPLAFYIGYNYVF